MPDSFKCKPTGWLGEASLTALRSVWEREVASAVTYVYNGTGLDMEYVRGHLEWLELCGRYNVLGEARKIIDCYNLPVTFDHGGTLCEEEQAMSKQISLLVRDGQHVF